jgi:uncharacterized membrane protein YfcA
LVGIPCGFLTGISGIGSSTLVGTLVRYLLGLRDRRANGAALLTTLASTIGCLIAYSQHNALHWLLAFIVLVGQIFGAAFGQRLKGATAALQVLRPVLSVLVMALGIYMMATRNNHSVLVSLVGLNLMVCGFGVGVVIGMISGILEIGGVLTVPASLYLLGLPIMTSQGLSVLVLLFASLPAAAAYISSNAVEARSASWIPFGAIFGALSGAYYATSRFPSGMLIDIDGLIITLFGLYHLLNRQSPQPAISEDESLRSE